MTTNNISEFIQLDGFSQFFDGQFLVFKIIVSSLGERRYRIPYRSKKRKFNNKILFVKNSLLQTEVYTLISEYFNQKKIVLFHDSPCCDGGFQFNLSCEEEFTISCFCQTASEWYWVPQSKYLSQKQYLIYRLCAREHFDPERGTFDRDFKFYQEIDGEFDFPAPFCFAAEEEVSDGEEGQTRWVITNENTIKQKALDLLHRNMERQYRLKKKRYFDEQQGFETKLQHYETFFSKDAPAPYQHHGDSIPNLRFMWDDQIFMYFLGNPILNHSIEFDRAKEEVYPSILMFFNSPHKIDDLLMRMVIQIAFQHEISLIHSGRSLFPYNLSFFMFEASGFIPTSLKRGHWYESPTPSCSSSERNAFTGRTIRGTYQPYPGYTLASTIMAQFAGRNLINTFIVQNYEKQLTMLYKIPTTFESDAFKKDPEDDDDEDEENKERIQTTQYDLDFLKKHWINLPRPHVFFKHLYQLFLVKEKRTIFKKALFRHVDIHGCMYCTQLIAMIILKNTYSQAWNVQHHDCPDEQIFAPFSSKDAQNMNLELVMALLCGIDLHMYRFKVWHAFYHRLLRVHLAMPDPLHVVLDCVRFIQSHIAFFIAEPMWFGDIPENKLTQLLMKSHMLYSNFRNPIKIVHQFLHQTCFFPNEKITDVQYVAIFIAFRLQTHTHQTDFYLSRNEDNVLLISARNNLCHPFFIRHPLYPLQGENE